MLLCVGEFFNTSPECQQQWEDFLKGRELGKWKEQVIVHCLFILNSPQLQYPHLFWALKHLMLPSFTRVFIQMEANFVKTSFF